jgi:hypothetical protein
VAGKWAYRKSGSAIGGKRSLVTMTPEERSARAKKAAMAAAKNRTAERLGEGTHGKAEAAGEESADARGK